MKSKSLPNSENRKQPQTAVGSIVPEKIIPPSGKRKKPIRIMARFETDSEVHKQVDAAFNQHFIRWGFYK